eukprot:6174119-Pleurochrysis_carterae.AAC.1
MRSGRRRAHGQSGATRHGQAGRQPGQAGALLGSPPSGLADMNPRKHASTLACPHMSAHTHTGKRKGAGMHVHKF